MKFLTKITNITTYAKVKNICKGTIYYSVSGGASGFQFSYSKSKSMKSASSISTSSGICYYQLKKGTTYYFRVRAYTEVDGKKYYGAWSSIVKRKIK